LQSPSQFYSPNQRFVSPSSSEFNSRQQMVARAGQDLSSRFQPARDNNPDSDFTSPRGGKMHYSKKTHRMKKTRRIKRKGRKRRTARK